MSQKQQKPTLTGQRIRTRKRDEKEKYDAASFRDQIIAGLVEADGDFEAASKFLDLTGNKLDFRRYVEALFDVLFAGGLLAPGGNLEEGAARSPMCIFVAKDTDGDDIRSYIELLNKLIRRYKYLQKGFEENLAKILRFLRSFSAEENARLAGATALSISSGLASATVLSSLISDHLLRDGVALKFVTQVFKVWIAKASLDNLGITLRKAGMDSRLLEFFPPNKQQTEVLEQHFKDEGLSGLVDLYRRKEVANIKGELKTALADIFGAEDFSVTDMANVVTETIQKHPISEVEAAIMLWDLLMDLVEWNKKPELIETQALKHIKQIAPVLAPYTKKFRTQVALLVRMQNYCYDNMNFVKIFSKICMLLYNADVLGEDAVLKWYTEGHSPKGKTVFLQQMKAMVDWLQSAPEESSEEEAQS